jgi:DNA-directed RNA polymerase omega subunit
MTTKISSRGTQIDTEQCVEQVENRFDLILIASARARELVRRHKKSGNTAHINPMVTSLLDIQNGKVGREYLKKIN